jgi:hypothetical protein
MTLGEFQAVCLTAKKPPGGVLEMKVHIPGDAESHKGFFKMVETGAGGALLVQDRQPALYISLSHVCAVEFV